MVSGIVCVVFLFVCLFVSFVIEYGPCFIFVEK